MDQRITKLLHRFFEGECTAEEEAILNNWYDSFDRDQPFPEMPDPETLKLYQELILRKIEQKIDAFEAENPAKEVKLSRKLIPGWLRFSVAAAILLAATFFFLDLPVSRKVQTDLQVNNLHIIKYNNPSNFLKKITLPDESCVWLSPNSGLELSSNFGEMKRDVRLFGKAFFQVTKNKQKPFIITSHSFVTRVWGTSFTISDQPGGGLARVSVLTGKVSVSFQNKTEKAVRSQFEDVLLLPNQCVTFRSDKRSMSKTTQKNSNDLNLWRTVSLSFHNEKMSEVIKKLNENFNVHIVADQPAISDYLLFADFTDQNLPSILEVLKVSLDINYKIEENEITLRSNK